MRLHDIALVFVRVLAATQLVQAAIGLVFTSIRISIAVSASAHSTIQHFITATELSQLTFPLGEAAFAVVVLALSRPIARFASKRAPQPS